MRFVDIIICSLEPGTARLAVEPCGDRERMDCRRLIGELERLIAARGLRRLCRVKEACAGGCSLPGPNLGVEVFEGPAGGDRAGWRSYAGSLHTLDALSRILDEQFPDRAKRGRLPDR